MILWSQFSSTFMWNLTVELRSADLYSKHYLLGYFAFSDFIYYLSLIMCVYFMFWLMSLLGLNACTSTAQLFSNNLVDYIPLLKLLYVSIKEIFVCIFKNFIVYTMWEYACVPCTCLLDSAESLRLHWVPCGWSCRW